MTSPSSSAPPEAILPATRAGIAEAARQLVAGNLIILPTETVYGIAVNLRHPQARQAARAIKAQAAGSQGVESSPWVLHVASPEDVLGWVLHLSPVGRRLISKAMPGPVAFQIKLEGEDLAAARRRLGDAADETIADGFVTFRCPDADATTQVLASVDAPMAIIGAGTRAQPGVFEVADVPAGLIGGGVQAVLDGGPTRYRKSSTVVRIEGEKYSVVRQGVIDERIIDRFAEFVVLFICSGNTCRSPMASAIAARQIATRVGVEPNELPLRRIVVQSAGVHASRGMRATMEAVEAVKEYGGDLARHQSQPATTDLLRRADVIYTMTNAHRDEVLELLPAAERKTFLLDPEGDVSDPIGSSFSVYQQVAARLSAVLKRRVEELSL